MAEEEKNDDSEGAAEGAEPKAEAPKKKLPLLQIALGIQLIVILSATGVLVKFALFTTRIKITREVLGERAIASLRDQSDKIKVIDIEEMTVNLPDQRTLMAHIQIEVSNDEVELELQKRMPALKARLLNILGTENSLDAENLQGKLLIKEKIRSSFNSELEKVNWDASKGVVREVFFVNLIMQ